MSGWRRLACHVPLPMRMALVCSTTLRPYHGDRRSPDLRIDWAAFDLKSSPAADRRPVRIGQGAIYRGNDPRLSTALTTQLATPLSRARGLRSLGYVEFFFCKKPTPVTTETWSSGSLPSSRTSQSGATPSGSGRRGPRIHTSWAVSSPPPWTARSPVGASRSSATYPRPNGAAAQWWVARDAGRPIHGSRLYRMPAAARSAATCTRGSG